MVTDFTVFFTELSASDAADIQTSVTQTISDAVTGGTFGLTVVPGSLSVASPGR